MRGRSKKEEASQEKGGRKPYRYTTRKERRVHSIALLLTRASSPIPGPNAQCPSWKTADCPAYCIHADPQVSVQQSGIRIHMRAFRVVDDALNWDAWCFSVCKGRFDDVSKVVSRRRWRWRWRWFFPHINAIALNWTEHGAVCREWKTTRPSAHQARGRHHGPNGPTEYSPHSAPPEHLGLTQRLGMTLFCLKWPNLDREARKPKRRLTITSLRSRPPTTECPERA